MTDAFRHDAAPYVLGALPPEERRAFEEHLAACPACEAAVREFAGLPGLLSRLPAAEAPAVLHGEEDRPPPPSLLTSLLQRARAERRTRRWRTILVAAAAAGLTAVGGAVLVDTVGDAPAQEQVASLPFVRTSERIPVTAEATLTDVPGGTRIDMTCRYTGTVGDRTREYVLWVVRRSSGERTRLGSWPVLSTDDYKMSVVAPLPRDRIDYFDVTSGSGNSLLTLRL